MQPLMEPAQSPSPTGADGLVLEARLSHAEVGRRVVEASAWLRGSCLGRCLGEANDAETAEDRALERLRRSLGNLSLSGGIRLDSSEPTGAGSAQRRPAPAPTRLAGQGQSRLEEEPSAASQAPAAAPIPRGDVGNGQEQQVDPDDWSEELTELDAQLQRLGWDREQEGRYLERSFGHPSRSRLTTYSDVRSYLEALRTLSQGSKPDQATTPLRRSDLISQSNLLLEKLAWSSAEGRSALERQFNCISRQQLTNEQIVIFNLFLEDELTKRESTQP